jgi:hypothetical protein
VAVAGGGIVGGKVIGKTTADGGDIDENPVTVNDLFSSFCQALHIDPRKENQSPAGRPLRLVDGGQPIAELFS